MLCSHRPERSAPRHMQAIRNAALRGDGEASMLQLGVNDLDQRIFHVSCAAALTAPGRTGRCARARARTGWPQRQVLHCRPPQWSAARDHFLRSNRAEEAGAKCLGTYAWRGGDLRQQEGVTERQVLRRCPGGTTLRKRTTPACISDIGLHTPSLVAWYIQSQNAAKGGKRTDDNAAEQPL